LWPHKKLEAGTVGELGKISNVVHGGAEAISPTQYRISGSEKTAPMKIADDDAAAASIRNIHRTETADAHQNIGSATRTGIWPETMAEFVAAIREKVARLIELFEQIAGGHFSRGNLDKDVVETNANVKLAIFSPAQVKQKALNVLGYQDIEPERVLFLLRND
jgi:hypothetical protein